MRRKTDRQTDTHTHAHWHLYATLTHTYIHTTHTHNFKEFFDCIQRSAYLCRIINCSTPASPSILAPDSSEHGLNISNKQPLPTAITNHLIDIMYQYSISFQPTCCCLLSVSKFRRMPKRTYRIEFPIPRSETDINY